MKRIGLLLMATLLLLTSLTGCSGGGSTPTKIDGMTAIKLLLAEERLDAAELKSRTDLLENDVQVMHSLANKAVANLGICRLDTGASIMRMATVAKTSTVLKGDYIGQVEIDGDTFAWSGFEESNNSYEYFKNITDNIVSSANAAADMIDFVKKNIRVVDKWVDMKNGQKYYLHVGENEELLCEEDSANDHLQVFRRYKDAQGRDVYELYRRQEQNEERMTYVPGVRYELSMLFEDDSQYFVADNEKGYWENYIVGAMPEHYNVSYFIMKDDICYDCFYDPKTQLQTMLKVMSSDKATDILQFQDEVEISAVTVQFSGFDGIRCVTAPADAVSYQTGEYANLDNCEKATVHLNNGKTVQAWDTYMDGKVEVVGVNVGYGVEGYTGFIDLRIRGTSTDVRLELLKSFLNEVGLTCRRNIHAVIAGIDRAYTELKSVTAHYRWNNESVTDEAGIERAIAAEQKRIAAMDGLYTALADVEVLDFEDTETLELNIRFAPITEQVADGAVLADAVVTTGALSLTVTDTTLFVEEEPYKVLFALQAKDEKGSLIHMEADHTDTVSYAGETSFTVNTAGATFALPALAPGAYTVVAYIATADGIRASAPTAVSFASVAEQPAVLGATSAAAVRESDGTVTVTYTETTDVALEWTSDTALNYAAFYERMAALVFEHGIPAADKPEMLVGEAYAPLTGDEAVMADGVYRMAYTLQNGEATTAGYVYVTYTCTAE